MPDAEGICRPDQWFRPPPAGGRQRHSRHVEDRDRQFRDHAGALRAGAGHAAMLRPPGAAGARGRHRLVDAVAGRAARHDRRQARAQSDHAQPPLQRDQVHRSRRQGHGQRQRRSRARHFVRSRTPASASAPRIFRASATVLSGALELQPSPRRHRSRSLDRQRAAGVARRRPRHLQPASAKGRASPSVCRSIAQAPVLPTHRPRSSHRRSSNCCRAASTRERRMSW